MSGFATVANERECWECGAKVPRHRHDRAYAAIVLSGAYEECGSRGRFRVEPGDVLLHDAFDAHLDRFQRGGAQILNLVVDHPGFSIGHIADPDTIARASERDAAAASALLHMQLRETNATVQDWPDVLAADLITNPDCRLDAWADAHDLAAETISRGFGKLFGITPAAFRLDARAHRALAMIRSTALPLATIAARTGFADQAHMSRATRALTGRPPRHWRRSNPFKTEQALAA